MLLRIDPSSPEPLADQLAAAVRGAVVGGDLPSGARLPSARELAASLDINMHTVLRAYAVLQREGVLEVRRGRGTVVTGKPPAHTEILQLVEKLRTAGRRYGVPAERLAALVIDPQKPIPEGKSS